MEILAVIVSLLIGLAIGYFFSIKIQQTKSEAELLLLNEKEKNHLEKINALQNETQQRKDEAVLLLQKNESLNIKLATALQESQSLQTKINEIKLEFANTNEKYTKEFENLANKILNDNSQKIATQNETQLKSILDPLKEKITHFEKRVNDTHLESEKERSALKEQLRTLSEINKKMSEEALNLTKALKGDNKKQGNWGEFILEKILEKSGLVKGREYSAQQSFTTEDGSRLQPDVIINLPDNKSLVVDAKVSLVAYEKYVATDDADNDTQAVFLKEHIHSIQSHVKNLSSKNYHQIYNINSPDFVLLFIPIESAFSLAISHDNDLYTDAFDKNVVIVSPATLLATLRTIANIWKQENQNINALEIAKYGADLYDKFVGFIEDLKKVGVKLEDAQKAYDEAEKKLYEGKGNLVRRAEHMKSLGLKASKQIPAEILHKSTE